MRIKIGSTAIIILLCFLLGACTPPTTANAESSSESDVSSVESEISAAESDASAVEPSSSSPTSKPEPVFPLVVNGETLTEPMRLDHFPQKDYQRGNAGIYSDSDAFLVLKNVFLYELDREHLRLTRVSVGPLVYTSADSTQLIDEKAINVIGADEKGIYYTQLTVEENVYRASELVHLVTVKTRQVQTHSFVNLVHYNVLTGEKTSVQQGVAEVYLQDGFLYWIDTQNPALTIWQQDVSSGEKKIVFDAIEYENQNRKAVPQESEEGLLMKVEGSTIYLEGRFSKHAQPSLYNLYIIDAVTGEVTFYRKAYAEERPEMTLENPDYVGESMDPEKGLQINGHMLRPDAENAKTIVTEEGTPVAKSWARTRYFYNQDKTLLYIDNGIDSGYVVTDGVSAFTIYIPSIEYAREIHNQQSAKETQILPLGEIEEAAQLTESAADPYPYGILFQNDGSIYYFMSFYYQDEIEIFRLTGTAENLQAFEWVGTHPGDYSNFALTGPYLVNVYGKNNYDIVRFG